MPTRRISIKEFAHFATRHSEVLEALFERASEEFTFPVLVRIAESTWQEGNPSAETIARNLVDMRIVEATDHTGSTFRYSPAIADLQRHLALTPDPVSARSILANVSDLADTNANIRRAIEIGDGGLALRAHEDLRRLCTNILRGVAENFRFVMNEVLDLKKASASITLRDRYARLDYSWTRYADPLRVMLLADGDFSQRMSAAENLIKRACESGLFPNRDQPESLRRYISIVLQSTNLAIVDCVRTVQPLLERLREDSMVAAGAAVGMAQFTKCGAIPSGIIKLLPVAFSAERDCFADAELDQTLRAILTIRPAPPPVIPDVHGGRTAGADAAFVAEAIESLSTAGEVPDLLAHLLNKHPDRTAYDCLCVFHHLTKPSSGFSPTFGPLAEFDFSDAIVTSSRLSISKQ